MNDFNGWKDYWNNAGNSSNNDIRIISGWGMDRSLNDMLYVINDVIEKLNLSIEDVFLDVGCGAGLFEIAFAHRVKQIFAIDYSETIVSKAIKNVSYDNVQIDVGDIRDLKFPSNNFDKLLVNGVIHYLDDYEDVKKAIGEVIRVAKKDGYILISWIPNFHAKTVFEDGYNRLGLHKDEILKKIEISNSHLWFKPETLEGIIRDYEPQSITVLSPYNDFHKKYYFEVLIKK